MAGTSLLRCVADTKEEEEKDVAAAVLLSLVRPLLNQGDSFIICNRMCDHTWIHANIPQISSTNLVPQTN